MAAKTLAHQRSVLQKRAEVAKHAESIKKLRIKMTTAKAQLKQMRGK